VESFKPVSQDAVIGKSVKYRAPSWSWASVDGTVTPLDERSKCTSRMLLKILECKIDLVNPSDPFGMVSGGHIYVRGLLKRAYGLKYEEEEEEEFAFVCGLRQENDNSSQFEIGDCWMDDETLKGTETVNAADGLYMLLVTKHSNRTSIMLIPVQGRSGVFQRVGFACSVLEEQQQWFDDAQEQTITII
jgi:hypothetical protein